MVIVVYVDSDGVDDMVGHILDGGLSQYDPALTVGASIYGVQIPMLDMEGRPMDLPAAKGRTWRLRRYEVEHEPDGLWGASDGARGVARCKTPFGAIYRLWKLRNGR